MPLTEEQSKEVFLALCEKFEKFGATPEDMIGYIAHLLVGTLAKNEVPKKNAFKYLDEMKNIFIHYQKKIERERNVDPILKQLDNIYNDNEEALVTAIKQMKDNPNEDGMLFSKDLRDRISKFGDMDVTDALKNPDFWKELCAHAGMSEEEIERITNLRGRDE